MAKSNYLEQQLLNHVLRNVAYTPPAAVYVGLYTAPPTDAGGGTEVSGGSYARQAVTFSAPSPDSSSNSVQVTFPTATADWGDIVAFGLFDAVSAGNMLYYTALSPTRTVLTNDQLRFIVGALVVTED